MSIQRRRRTGFHASEGKRMKGKGRDRGQIVAGCPDPRQFYPHNASIRTVLYVISVAAGCWRVKDEAAQAPYLQSLADAVSNAGRLSQNIYDACEWSYIVKTHWYNHGRSAERSSCMQSTKPLHSSSVLM